MANHSSAKKAYRQSLKKSLVNKSRLSSIKTYIKKLIVLIKTGSKEEVNSAFIIAQSKIMKGVNKKVLKPNTAARKVSGLSQKIKKMV